MPDVEYERLDHTALHCGSAVGYVDRLERAVEASRLVEGYFPGAFLGLSLALKELDAYNCRLMTREERDEALAQATLRKLASNTGPLCDECLWTVRRVLAGEGRGEG